MQVYRDQASNKIVLCALVVSALFLLFACAPIRYPPVGHPVSLSQDEVLVVGHISMVSTRNPDIKYQAFWPDVWDEPFFGPGPRMTLELRWLNPKSPAFNYMSYPAPLVERDGYFYWILKPGDYLLLGNPRLFGSKNFNVEEAQALAHFRLPSAGGTIYLGSLVISIKYDLDEFVTSWNRGEANYEISGITVIDERESAFEKLLTQFQAIPEPTVVELMITEPR
jgi:hypothetical protein